MLIEDSREELYGAIMRASAEQDRRHYSDLICGSSWIATNPFASRPWAYQLASAFVLYNQPNEGMFGTYYPREGRGVFLTDTQGWLEVRGIVPW